MEPILQTGGGASKRHVCNQSIHHSVYIMFASYCEGCFQYAFLRYVARSRRRPGPRYAINQFRMQVNNATRLGPPKTMVVDRPAL